MRYLVLAVFLFGILCQGITSAEAADTKPVIKADKSYYDINSGLYILNGNVYIEIRNQKITAGQAKASLSTMEIWGNGGVTFTQDDMYLTAGNVRVISAQSRALIEGSVNFSRGDLTIMADRAELNWDKKLARFEGNIKLTKGGKVDTTEILIYNIETNTWQ